MKNKFLILFLFLIFCSLSVRGQSSLNPPDLSVPTKIAPKYFGPSAFMVPEMMDGTTFAKWKIELYSDHFLGTTAGWKQDYTTDIFARLTIPLFTPRINLVIWGPLYEYSLTGPDVNKHRRIDSSEYISSHTAGDIFVSTNIHLLREKSHWLDLSLRVALKTASGGAYHYARYYDNPGYYFDASFGKSFSFLDDNAKLRFALSSGFLCWQTDNGRQNDAVMYGILGTLSIRNFMLRVQYGGYVGWERDGDAPMTVRTDVAWIVGDFGLKFGYQAGLIDWPFHQFRFGLEYRFSLKNLIKKP